MSLNAQNQGFEITPLDKNLALQKATKSPQKRTKTKVADTLELPFYDDFSYKSVYPDARLWVDSCAYINDKMAYQPPSVGVATLDALNKNGTPYGKAGEVGSADTLTSQPLNLDNLTSSDQVGLSYWYQPKGLCYPPNNGDSLILEFKNQSGTWDKIRAYDGLPNSTTVDALPAFQYAFVTITDAKYLFKGFQFRFRNLGRLHGIYEIWHIDYVKIDKQRQAADPTADVAFVQPPRPILKNYTAIPWKQLRASLATELIDSLSVGYNSQFANINNFTDSRVSIRETVTNQETFTPFAFLTGRTVEANKAAYFTLPFIPKNEFQTNMSQLFEGKGDSFVFETKYFYNVNRSQEQGAIRNDTVATQTVCSNYYAYDDGTAELQITATGDGIQSAIRFNASVADTIRGFQFAHPHVRTDATNVRFNIKIYKETLNSTPIFSQNNVQPVYADTYFDTLQAFTTYRLNGTDGKPTFVPIPAGNYFVAWQQVGDVKLPIGLDRNNLEASKHFFQLIDGAWKQASSRPIGAIMLRPLVGNKTPIATNNQEVLLSNLVKVYPNPATSEILLELRPNADLDLENMTTEIRDLTGKLVLVERFSPSISIQSLVNGFYILSLKDTKSNQRYSQKISVLR